MAHILIRDLYLFFASQSRNYDRDAMAKMATLRQNWLLLTDCSHRPSFSSPTVSKMLSLPTADVIPIPKNLTTQPFLPAGKTMQKVQVAVSWFTLAPVMQVL
jgi:hypothetical protein